MTSGPRDVPRGTFGTREDLRRDVPRGTFPPRDVPEDVPRGTLHPRECLPDDARERLEAYTRLVDRWSRRLNLVGAADLDRFWSRHIADCLRVLPLVRSLPAGPAVDVGSGAGLPGVVLAIADSGRPWRLLEPDRLRAAFLEEVERELALEVEVISLRAQEAARSPRLGGRHVLATGRALARPAQAFELLEPLLAPGAVGVVFVGKRAAIPKQAEAWGEGIAIIRRGRRGLLEK